MDAQAASAEQADPQILINRETWGSRNLLAEYSGRVLRPPEVMVLVRHRETLSGRVLELGCGGGRLSGYLIGIAQEFHGLDISPTMVRHCQEAHPNGVFVEGDLCDLSRYDTGYFEAVIAPFNVIDVLNDEDRRRVLSAIHRILQDHGLLVMSSHNLAYAPRIRKPTQVISRDPVTLAKRLVRLPRHARNWRRLAPFQKTAPDHAVLVDEAHGYSLLHYYIRQDDQRRQLAELGFELLECLDLDGKPVAPGNAAASHAELHYVARAQDAPLAR